ncbi:hypothetical protein [Sphaerisporangium dianthi]|uniref:Uncharacterized protein n=1 Tax=Sphaerisporangium dianthi TaxID=1436120 RepID=A0ABV9CJF7_9ACTN
MRRQRGGVVHRLASVCALVVARTGTAHAGTWRSADATGSGPTPWAGAQNAEANARATLASQAARLGEVCTNMTATSTLIYTAPGGAAYVYSATATGLCAPAPPAPAYTVPRSATAQGSGGNSLTARNNAAAAARAAVLAAGVDCTGWTTTYSTVWTAPDGSWYIYNATVTAMCTT